MSVHPCAILADKNGYAWDFAQKVHANLAGRNGGFDLVPIEYQKFRDGEEKPRILENVRKRNCYFIHDTSLEPSLWRTRIKDVNYAIKFSSAQSVIDVLPYFKYARQDRKDESRVPITAKVVAKEISVDADSALILDLHNQAIQGFFDIPTDTLYSFPVIINYLRGRYQGLLERVVVMSPDTGGAKRAESFARRAANNELVICYKSRPKAGIVGKLIILGDVQGGDLKDRDVFLIDDMIDSGGTFSKAAQAARNAGASHVYGYATFGLFTEGVKNVSDKFDKLFIGDIFPLPLEPGESKPANIEMVDFTSLFAEAIYCTSEGKPLSELLN